MHASSLKIIQKPKHNAIEILLSLKTINFIKIHVEY